MRPVTPPVPRRRGPLVISLLAIVALLVPSAAIAAPAVPGRTVDVQILGLSDWHGQVDPISGVGGAAVLKAYLDAARSKYANNLTLTAGDDVGATPPVSNYFEDVPSILAQRMMGIQVGSLGNHNFDSGIERLQDQIDLAGSSDPSVPGSPFRYVSSNLSNRDANITGVSDYVIFSFKGVKVAVIGVTNEEAPGLNFPGAMGTMVPTDGVAAAMAAKEAARAAGANVFVAITHKGVTSFENGEPRGELIDFAKGVSGFQVILGDHTDIQWSGTVNGQFVTENRSKGVSFSKIVLTVKRGTGKLVNLQHTFVSPVAADVTPDAGITAMLAPYRAQLAPVFNTQLGDSERTIPRGDRCGGSSGRLCESLIGNVLSDAIRATHGTDFGLSNSGGIRADLTCPTTDSSTDFCPAFTPGTYPITRGQVNTVLPFGNISTVVTIDGAVLKAALENGVSRIPSADGRFPQVSGMCMTFDVQAAAGSRLTSVVRQASDGTCSGPAVDLTAVSTYTVATNDFVAAGGDSYPVMPDRVTFGFLDQEVSDWIAEQGTLIPAYQGRIECTDSDPALAPACPVKIE